ncbi:MAG TPA: FAD-dependent oxidoreductase, partial [Beijerinckiaceae bacterium]|nr:FAD-dependent oxidoreductase [Beijerinckiaceae bacterium]
MLDSRAVTVVGAGVAGTWQALLFQRAGFDVTVVERGDASLAGAAAYWAGGMLAPGCEAETAEPIVTRLGRRSLDLWRAHLPDVAVNGSLIVAHPRDRADYERFARLTSGYERVDAQRLGVLEPALAGRFREGLFFPNEAHVEPRHVLPELHKQLQTMGAVIRFNQAA